MRHIAHLPDRAVLAITGADRVAFLNGLVSGDVAEAAPGRAVWAALLTAQGKWLADFFVLVEGGQLLLDCEAGQAAMVASRLGRYRLRSDATIAPSALRVSVAWGGDGRPDGDVVAPDPRLAEAGWRILSAVPPVANASAQDWDIFRLRLGLPDGSNDLDSEKTVLLEAGFDELRGVSWTKGCFMGQELTARTRYRGLVKRRLLPVQGCEDLPPRGTPIMCDGVEVGQMRSSRGLDGLALMRLDALDKRLEAAGRPVSLHLPAWVSLTPLLVGQVAQLA